MAHQRSSSSSNRHPSDLSLIVCKDCGVRMVVRRVSGQPWSKGNVFYCCPDHKRDGSGCPFFRWEKVYIRQLNELSKEGVKMKEAEAESEVPDKFGYNDNVIYKKEARLELMRQIVHLLLAILGVGICILLVLVLLLGVMLTK
ncbi:hypothetical protein BS78_03G126200 [Paspalum vaginatum]|nr:hypothetical protein BS78_03G126200 [Paspalum vaginatum]